MKQCPYCAESIKDEAIICRFCSSALPWPGQEAPVSPGAVRFASRPRWARISLSVFLAGSIPTVLSYSALTILLLVVGPGSSFRPAYVLFHFLVHLLPLALGISAAHAWPGRHPKGHAALGALAATTEAATIWLFIAIVSPHIYPLILRWEDFAGLVATATLFTAGGLLGDLRELRERGPRPSPERTPTGGMPHRQSGTDQRALLLVQALGPAALALVGTAINAVVALATGP